MPASWSKELNEPNKELSPVDADMISFGLAKEGGMAKAVDGRRLSGRWLAKEGGLLEAAKKMYSYYIEEFTLAKHWKDRPNKRVFYARRITDKTGWTEGFDLCHYVYPKDSAAWKRTFCPRILVGCRVLDNTALARNMALNLKR